MPKRVLDMLSVGEGPLVDILVLIFGVRFLCGLGLFGENATTICLKGKSDHLWS